MRRKRHRYRRVSAFRAPKKSSELVALHLGMIGILGMRGVLVLAVFMVAMLVPTAFVVAVFVVAVFVVAMFDLAGILPAFDLDIEPRLGIPGQHGGKQRLVG